MLSTGRYRPTQAMADLISALDGTCRAPVCTIAASTCDIDHNRPWPHGPTTIANLSAKHRRHHNHKNRGTWRCEADLHGTLTWTTLTGRRYTTSHLSYTPARRGRPRRRMGLESQPVRVELRLPVEVAALLFDLAGSSGRTVSSVGADALRDGLRGEIAM